MFLLQVAELFTGWFGSRIEKADEFCEIYFIDKLWTDLLTKKKLYKVVFDLLIGPY